MVIDYIALGKRIKYARKQKNMTQEQLASATGMSQQHIGNIEIAANKLSLQALVDIAAALNTTVDALLYDSLPSAVNTYDLDAKNILSDCTDQERESLIHIMQEVKSALRSNKA